MKSSHHFNARYFVIYVMDLTVLCCFSKFGLRALLIKYIVMLKYIGIFELMSQIIKDQMVGKLTTNNLEIIEMHWN